MAAFKICALAMLLACCVFENASAENWRNAVKNNYIRRIYSIFFGTMTYTDAESNIVAKDRSGAAEDCLDLRTLSTICETASDQINSCVRDVDNQHMAIRCALKVMSNLIEQAATVRRDIDVCMKNVQSL